MSLANGLPLSPAASQPPPPDAYASLSRRPPAYSDPNTRQQQTQTQMPYAPLPGARPASAHVLQTASSSPGSTPQVDARKQAAAAKAKGTPPPPPSAASKPPVPVPAGATTRAGGQQQTPKKEMSPGGTIRMIAKQTPGGTARIFVLADETDGGRPGAGPTLQSSQSYTSLGNPSAPVAASARANGLAILPARNADGGSFKRQAEELREQYLRSHEERMGRIDVRIDNLHSVTANSTPSRTIAEAARGVADPSRFMVYDDGDDTTL